MAEFGHFGLFTPSKKTEKEEQKEQKQEEQKEEPIYPPRTESLSVAPVAMSLNKTEVKLLIGGNHMLKLFDVTSDMRLAAQDRDLPEKFRMLSRNTIKDVVWNPCKRLFLSLSLRGTVCGGEHGEAGDGV